LFFAKCTALPFGGLVFNSTFWAGSDKVFRSDAGCGGECFSSTRLRGSGRGVGLPGNPVGL
jgi:hypothetical protein